MGDSVVVDLGSVVVCVVASALVVVDGFGVLKPPTLTNWIIGMLIFESDPIDSFTESLLNFTLSSK